MKNRDAEYIKNSESIDSGKKTYAPDPKPTKAPKKGKRK